MLIIYPDEAANRRLGLQALKRELPQARSARETAAAVAGIASEELMDRGGVVGAPSGSVDPLP
jgi:hypothetical protein